MLNFLKYFIFFPKLLIFHGDRRFNYWVGSLSFFLINCTGSLSNKHELNTVDETNFLGVKNKFFNLDFFIFNFRRYFFSFLLLKLFLNYSTSKIVFKKLIPGRKTLLKEVHSSTRAELLKKNEKRLRPQLFKKLRVLFFVTSKTQHWFIKKIFSKESFILILLENNLLTNRYFFYKILFGFYNQRQNIIFPKLAVKAANPKKFFFDNCYTRDSVFYDFKLYYFLSIKTTALSRIFNSTIAFVDFFISFLYFLKPNLNKLLKKLIFSFSYRFLEIFWYFFWFKNILKLEAEHYNNIIGWRTFFSGYFLKFKKDPSFFFTKFFKVNLNNFFNNTINKLFFEFTQYKNFYSKEFFLYSVFSKAIKDLNDPFKLKNRRNLLDLIMLLNFLPIDLIILLSSATNKQALRDVFRFFKPVILISSIENPNRLSDYSFPGTALDLNILYFYMKFLLDLLKFSRKY